MASNELLTMTSVPETAWAFIEMLSKRESLVDFLEIYKFSKPETANLTADILLKVLQKNVKTIFVDYHWGFQTKPDWVGRSPQFALREALLQSLTAVSMDVELCIMDRRDRQGKTIEEWKLIKLSAQTLDPYFRQIMTRTQR